MGKLDNNSFGGILKKYLITLISATLLAINISATPASASTGCDSYEQTLVNAINAIQTSAGLPNVTNAASNYRTCLSTYADSRNSYSGDFLTAGGFFYSIMTKWNTYLYAGRSYAMKAAADYRMALLGEESTINTKTGSSTCNTTYQNLIGLAQGNGDISLAAFARDAYTSCPIIRSSPSAYVTWSYSGSLGVGTTLRANSGEWPYNVSIGYQWYRDSTPISGASNSEYVVQTTDAGYRIRVRVTGSRSGLNSVSRDSAYTNTILLSQSATPTPTISGTAKVDQTLTANPGSWDSGVALSYAWTRDGAAIPNATSSTYLLTGFDVNRSIAVQVTGSKSGYNSATKQSSPVTVLGLDIKLAPTPTIDSNLRVGTSSFSVAGTWESGVTLTYQWLRDGSNIPDATTSSYTPTSDDYQHQISLRVTGTKFGYTTLSKVSLSYAPALGTITLPTLPSISGSVTTGSTISASVGPVDSGVTREFQWLRDGGAVPDATGESYLLTTLDFGRAVSVKVTFSRVGYTTASLTSTPSQVAGGNLIITPTPSFVGTTKVGQPLTATAGNWGAGVDVAFQWLREGSPIEGATSETYYTTGADYLKRISVQVTGSSLGFNPTSKQSPALLITVGTLIKTQTPWRFSDLFVHRPVACSAADAWDEDVVLSYVWLLDDVAIAGATGDSYTPKVSDFDHYLSCQVTGSKLGYESQTITRPATWKINKGYFLDTQLLGEAKVGATLTIDNGIWPENTLINSISWVRTSRGGVSTTIEGQTGLTYLVSVADADSDVSAVLSLSATGMNSRADVKGLVHIPKFSDLNPVEFVGDLRLGKTFTINPGSWDSGTTTIVTVKNEADAVVATGTCQGSASCVWSGAQVDTQGRFSPIVSDAGSRLLVSVTGTYSGELASTETYATISEGVFDTSQMPDIKGDFRPGKTLSVDLVPLFPGATVKYQWGFEASTPFGILFVLYQGQTNSSFIAPNASTKVGLLVTLSSPGFASKTYMYPLKEVGLALQTKIPTPTISGSPKVGSKLSVNLGSWMDGTTKTVTWYRDGIAIGTANSLSYTPTASDYNHLFTVKVTGVNAGYESASSESDPILISAGSMSVTTPGITGTVKVGKVVTAKTAAWVSGAAITYQWLLDGKAIKGATAKTYKLLPAQKAKKLSLTVTQKRTGYTTATKTSAAIKVG